MFLWRTCSNILPTRDNLFRRKIQIDSTCELCRQTRETCAHLPWECPFARNVWAMMKGRVQKCSNEVHDFFHLFRYLGDKLTKQRGNWNSGLLYHGLFGMQKTKSILRKSNHSQRQQQKGRCCYWKHISRLWFLKPMYKSE